MKRVLFLFVVAFLSATFLADANPLVPDTIIRMNSKSIKIRETNDRLNVKVFEVSESNDTIYSDQVFEGVYKDGKSTERRFSKGLYIPMPKWNRISNPHWAGFSMGFAGLDRGNIDLKGGKSFEFMLNFYEHAFQISRFGWAIVTGAGFRWNTYRLDDNTHFAKLDGITYLLPAPDGIEYETSRLKIVHFTIPVLLEWQKKVTGGKRLFFSGGVVAGAKIYSNSVIKYYNKNGKQKDILGKDLNLRPITCDVLVQAGYGCVGLYAKYSPLSLFESGRGPELYPMSAGVMLHF